MTDENPERLSPRMKQHRAQILRREAVLVDAVALHSLGLFAAIVIAFGAIVAASVWKYCQ